MGKKKPVIDPELCISCGACVEACPTKALEMGEKTPVLARPDVCDGRGDCADACPNSGIEMK